MNIEIADLEIYWKDFHKKRRIELRNKEEPKKGETYARLYDVKSAPESPAPLPHYRAT